MTGWDAWRGTGSPAPAGTFIRLLMDGAGELGVTLDLTHLDATIGLSGTSASVVNFNPDTVHPRPPGFLVWGTRLAAVVNALP